MCHFFLPCSHQSIFMNDSCTTSTCFLSWRLMSWILTAVYPQTHFLKCSAILQRVKSVLFRDSNHISGHDQYLFRYSYVHIYPDIIAPYTVRPLFWHAASILVFWLCVMTWNSHFFVLCKLEGIGNLCSCYFYILLVQLCSNMLCFTTPAFYYCTLFITKLRTGWRSTVPCELLYCNVLHCLHTFTLCNTE